MKYLLIPILTFLIFIIFFLPIVNSQVWVDATDPDNPDLVATTPDGARFVADRTIANGYTPTTKGEKTYIIKVDTSDPNRELFDVIFGHWVDTSHDIEPREGPYLGQATTTTSAPGGPQPPAGACNQQQGTYFPMYENWCPNQHPVVLGVYYPFYLTDPGHACWDCGDPTPPPPICGPGTIPNPKPDATCSGEWGNNFDIGGVAKTDAVMEALSDRLVIAVQGTDDKIYVKELNGEISNFTDWYPVHSGETIGRPKLVFDASNNLWLYMRGKDDVIYKSEYLSQGSWSDWQKTGICNEYFGKCPITGSPFVYSWNGFEYVYESDILSELTNSSMESTSAVALKHLEEPKIKITNELNEIDYINSIKLKVTSDREYYLNPISISKGSLNSILNDDGSYLVLNKGDEVTIQFEKLPIGANKIELVAKGYFTPLTSASEIKSVSSTSSTESHASLVGTTKGLSTDQIGTLLNSETNPFNLYKPSSDIGMEEVDGNWHIWNDKNDYYIDKTSGIQITNHYKEYWTKNFICIGFNQEEHCFNSADWSWEISKTESHTSLVGTTKLKFDSSLFEIKLEYYLEPGWDTIRIRTSIKNLNGELLNPYIKFYISDIKVGGDRSADTVNVNLKDGPKSWDLGSPLSIELTDATLKEREVEFGDKLKDSTITFKWGNIYWKNGKEYPQDFIIDISSKQETEMNLTFPLEKFYTGDEITTELFWVDEYTSGCVGGGGTCSCSNGQSCTSYLQCIKPSCTAGSCSSAPPYGAHLTRDGCGVNVNDYCTCMWTQGQPCAGSCSCTAGGTCSYACNSGLADCDGNFWGTGCEVNLNTYNNCGSCGNVCPDTYGTNGYPVCTNGVCGNTQCGSGYSDCDNNPSNGCEANLNTDPNNCQTCGNVCPDTYTVCGNPTCTNGVCGNTPYDTSTDCYGGCCDGSGLCKSFAGPIAVATNLDGGKTYIVRNQDGIILSECLASKSESNFHFLPFIANTTYLNVIWLVPQAAPSQPNLGINCTYTGIAAADCVPKPFIQGPGYGGCVVINPQYDFYNLNNVSCLVYLVSDMKTNTTFNTSFYPVAFIANTSLSSLSMTVGSQIQLRINVQNIGLFTDNYTVNITSPASYVYVSNPLSATGVVIGDPFDQSAFTSTSIAALAAPNQNQQITLFALINSTTYPKIGQVIPIVLKTGFASLADFTILGIIQIIILAALILLLKKK